MICKKCGKETSNVFCDNCGINVVWYNKYGYKQDIPTIHKDLDIYYDLEPEDSIEDVLADIFIPDGSGD